MPFKWALLLFYLRDKIRTHTPTLKQRHVHNHQSTSCLNNNRDLVSNWSLFTVCQEVRYGALVLLDASTPSVGPLIRSFARANGIVVMGMTDDVQLLPVDEAYQNFLYVEPPGTAMLRIVADMVRLDNLTNVAVLYDDTFSK